MNGEGKGWAATARGNRRDPGVRHWPPPSNRRNRGGGALLRAAAHVRPRTVPAVVLIAAASLVLCAAISATAAEAPPAWSYRPYRVTVVAALPRIAELPPAEHRTWCDALAGKLQSAYAPLWDTAVVAADAATEAILAEDPALLSAAQAHSLGRARPATTKVIFLAIHAGENRFGALAREYDADVGFLGPVERREAASPEALLGAAAAAVASAFAPQARFEALPNGSLTLRPRGAQLRTREPLAAWAEGDVARLFLRPKPIRVLAADDRSPEGAEGGAETKAAEDVSPPPAPEPNAAGDASAEEHEAPANQSEPDASRHAAVAIPWTAAVLSEVGSKGLVAQVITRLEAPFEQAHGLGIERLALRAGRSSRPAPLRLVAAESAVDYAVYDVGNPKQTVCLGLTDRHGRLVVPPGEGVLRRLAVSDGSRVLIEFPLIADGAAELEIPLVREALSPGVEVFLLPARNALIDELARRAGAVVRMETLLASKQWDKADELLAELKKLPAGKTWAADLMLRLGKPPAADARVTARLDAFRNEAQQALEKQLGSERLSQWEKKIAEGRKPPDPPEGQTDPASSTPPPGEGGTPPEGAPPESASSSGDSPSEGGAPAPSS